MPYNYNAWVEKLWNRPANARSISCIFIIFGFKSDNEKIILNLCKNNKINRIIKYYI